jgi:Methyltransferase domain
VPATAQQHRSNCALRSGPVAARRLARRVLVKRLRLVPAGSDVRPYALPAVARVLERRWERRLRRLPVTTLEAYAATVSPGEIEEIVACPLCAGRSLAAVQVRAAGPVALQRRALPELRIPIPQPRHPPGAAGRPVQPWRLLEIPARGYSHQRQEDYRRVLDAFGGLFADGSGRRLLDYGCGVGFFLEVAHKRGFDASGVDLSPDAVQEARRRGLAAWRSAPEEVPEIAAGGFDVITLWSVLAHLPRPVEDLSRLRALLAPDGVLLINTVNANSLLLKAYGTRWGGFTPNHLIFSSPETLPALLHKAGFAAVTSQPQYPRSVERGTSGLSARQQRRVRRAVERGNQGPLLRAAAFVRADGPARPGLPTASR